MAMAMLCPPPLVGGASVKALTVVALADAVVFSIKPDPEGTLPYPSNEIRISHLSPANERCPHIAFLRTIAPFSV